MDRPTLITSAHVMGLFGILAASYCPLGVIFYHSSSSYGLKNTVCPAPVAIRRTLERASAAIATIGVAASVVYAQSVTN